MNEKKIILLVDDDKSNLVIAQKLLADEYRVAAVNSGAMALRFLEKNKPDVILLDILMPEMDGFEVMKRIQENPELKSIPVIFLTADRSAKTEEDCFRMGAVDFIGKPFVPGIMLQRVHRTVELEEYRKSLEKIVQQQLQRITQLQSDIIITMANLIESRDGTTGEHVKRTSVYTHFLVGKMLEKGVYAEELTPKFVDYLCKAAPMHDIGKITVPDRILSKPGALTPEEYDMMKNHAAEGGKIIRDNMDRIADKEFVDIAFDMATYHHEKWNGMGYPSGKAGLDIPLSARILAVVDVFDALVSKRQYKEGMTLEQAFDIMRRDRGVAFEDKIWDVFEESADELREIMKEL